LVEADDLAASHEDPTKEVLSGYRLAGMFTSDLDAGVIIVGPDERRRLIVGESIDGWMLEEVRADEAFFVSRGGRGARRRAVLRLEHMLPKSGE
jgi:hypothetical protein